MATAPLEKFRTVKKSFSRACNNFIANFSSVELLCNKLHYSIRSHYSHFKIIRITFHSALIFSIAKGIASDGSYLDRIYLF